MGFVQLSILSRFYFYPKKGIVIEYVKILSILSRFYFYTTFECTEKLFLKLSILSRFYFYWYKPINYHADYYLSILSRFYFYLMMEHLLLKTILTFNPIKVLFLRIIEFINRCKYTSFNPIKVLFLLYTEKQDKKNVVTFNPIKVLFLPQQCLHISRNFKFLSILSRFYFYRSLWCALGGAERGFQSYQGSIFTRKSNDPKLARYLLSILSRFYFYIRSTVHLVRHILLSILSRFYFYPFLILSSLLYIFSFIFENFLQSSYFHRPI